VFKIFWSSNWPLHSTLNHVFYINQSQKHLNEITFIDSGVPMIEIGKTFLTVTSSSNSDSVAQFVRPFVCNQFLKFVVLCSFDHVAYIYAGDLVLKLGYWSKHSQEALRSVSRILGSMEKQYWVQLKQAQTKSVSLV